MLLEILTQHQAEIVTHARVRASERPAPNASDKLLTEGIPLFLQQLAEVVRSTLPGVDALGRTGAMHGDELLEAGFTVTQVIHAYRDICQAIIEVAREVAAVLGPDEHRTLHACLDAAIAHALIDYGRKRALVIAASDREQTREFAHEIRNLLNTAALAFDVLRDGNVANTGMTAAVLGKSLHAMRELVHQPLTELRLEARLCQAEPIRVSELVEELEINATLEAKAKQLRLVVSEVPRHLHVFGDRSLLASAISTLLQNALRFTRGESTVTLRVHSTELKVFVDVEDECGGLPPDKLEALFHPFEHDASNLRVGLGLQLARRAIEANGGVLRAHSRPDVGCTFSADLPRLHSDAA